MKQYLLLAKIRFDLSLLSLGFSQKMHPFPPAFCIYSILQGDHSLSNLRDDTLSDIII
jgi:hypothetical protein